MTTTPLSDVVSSQYARWMYPQPIHDLPGWLAGNWQWFDPSHAHRIFWPDQEYRPETDILVAGCGTNQAAVTAYTNPRARVVAVDVSEQSLGHHQFLKDKYALKNLELHRLPIEEIATLQQDFDLIISTGVLHHLASPEAGIQALAPCLRPDGVMALMLYAKYGRIGVDMMQSVFRDMGLGQNDASVLLVRETLAALAPDHPVRSYMAIAPDLGYDAGLVDTFLHGRERNYTIGECQDLVASCGLVFQDLLFKAPYHPPVGSTSAFHTAVAALPKERQWAVMEQINFRNGCHFFTACRADRPKSRYAIDFALEQALDYVPVLRYRCTLRDQQICRHDWRLNLDPTQHTLAKLVDGRRTVREITALAHTAANQATPDLAAFEAQVKTQFQVFWQLDFMAMAITGTL